MPKKNPAGKRLEHTQIFWSNVDVGGEDECWVWRGPVRAMYGVTNWHGKGIGGGDYRYIKAHIVSWGIHHDIDVDTRPLDPSCKNHRMGILHRCNNKLCVNPKHLYMGTHDQNMNDHKRSGNARLAAIKGWKGMTKEQRRERAIKAWQTRKLNKLLQVEDNENG